MDKLYVVTSRVMSREGLKILVCGDEIIVEVIILLMLFTKKFFKIYKLVCCCFYKAFLFALMYAYDLLIERNQDLFICSNYLVFFYLLDLVIHFSLFVYLIIFHPHISYFVNSFK